MRFLGARALRDALHGRRPRDLERLVDHGRIVGEWTVEKYEDDEAFLARRPFEVGAPFRNLLVTAGLAELGKLLTGNGGTAFSAANGNMGVGDSNAAAAVGQTDLQAVVNKVRVAINAPAVPGAGAYVWVAVFTALLGNFDWREFGMFNAAAAGTMLCRVVSVQGTKVAGQVWTPTYTLTVT